jgi:hypothetical protein
MRYSKSTDIEKKSEYFLVIKRCTKANEPLVWIKKKVEFERKTARGKQELEGGRRKKKWLTGKYA